MKKLSIILGIGLISGALFLLSGVQGAEYPARPINLIMPLEAGSDGDINLRPLMDRASTLLGKPIIVVNKPGAAQTIGYREILKAKPDGYTIGIGLLTLVTAKQQGLAPFDHHDFTIIAKIMTIDAVILGSKKTKRPFASVQEVLSFVKSNPGEVSLATSAKGGAWWLAAMVLQEAAKVKFNIIPQEGAGGFVVTQVAGGHTDLGILGMQTSIAQIEAGNIFPLGVFAPQRIQGRYGNVPTLKESGYDVSCGTFGIILGPPKMPKAICEKLTKVFETASNEEGYRKYLGERGCTVQFLPPDQAYRFLEEKREEYKAILHKAGLTKQ